MPHIKNKLVRSILFALVITYFCVSQTQPLIGEARSAPLEDFIMQPIVPPSSPASIDLPPIDESDTEESDEPEPEEPIAPKKMVNKITFIGNTLLPENALRAKIPYREGEPFDPLLTRMLINNINSLGYFNAIELQVEDISPTQVDLFIHIQEKTKIEQIVYEGNAHLRKDEIEKKLKLSEIPAMDEIEIKEYSDQIRNLYGEKNYHQAVVEAELRPTQQNTAVVVFKITEGSPSAVRKICFEGNKTFTAKKLRSIIYTREDWIFGFLDKAGSYQPDMLEGDKFVIEDFYQSHGFLTARVKDIRVEKDPNNPCLLAITYCVDEGDLYTVKTVSAVGNDIMSEPALLAGIPIRPGQYYSRELVRRSLELLRLVWGQFGYIYADIDPLIQPDHETKMVDISFASELGTKVYLDRINIIGNAKTRDYVIRRVLTLNEGNILRIPDMDESKANVEMLGFFEPRDGVNWKINKINENLASLDLMVKEIKTGKLFAQIGFGGADRDPTSPNSSAKITAGMGDRNFLGTGISYNLAFNYSREDRGLTFSVGNPWLFDRPITGAIEAYHRKSIYEDFRNLENIPVEVITGTSGI
jgi:outer membrane protein insertion porin family